MLDRRVQILGDQNDADSRVRRFSEFADIANLIVLGDPGIGKTTLFEAAAKRADTQYLKARIFLITPPEQLSDNLFIDALDEQRATTSGDVAIDAVAKHLWDRRPDRVRVACREREWLGETDLAVLNSYFHGNGGVTVLKLLPIDRDEQIEILAANDFAKDYAVQFLPEAEQRGFARLITNPQKMLMLARVERSGSWPTSTTELFRRATDIQLTEKNEYHARTSKGQFSPEELRLPSGAICAARLIADVDGICLDNMSASDRYPSYRNIDFVPQDKVLSVLHRLLFASTGPPMCVDYDHRTSAEFLAAYWIADQVRSAGLPIGRVQSLLGVGGRPVAELRGLNAWLPIALPEHAHIFIQSDPLGVLEYGDAASLTPAQRQILLEALANFAKENPSFLGRDRDVEAIGQLVQADSVSALCAILDAPGAPGDLRTLVLEAFGAAKPQDAAFDTLLRVLCDNRPYWGDRHRAMECVLAFGQRGEVALLKAFPAFMAAKDATLRLRGWAIKALYGKGLGASDVVALIRDLAGAKLSGSVGLLWELGDAIPSDDLANIIDQLATSVPKVGAEEDSRLAWDAASFIERVIARVLNERPNDLDGPRTFTWIKLRQRLRTVSADDDNKKFWEVIKSQNGLPRALLDAAIDAYQRDPARPGYLHRLIYEVILPAAEISDIADWSLDRFERETNADKRALAFELALNMSRGDTPRARAHFERVYSIAETDGALREVLQGYVVCDLSHHKPEYQEKAKARERQRREDHQQTRDKFASKRDDVRAGKSALLNFGADIYFDQYSDFDHTVSPKERIAIYLSEEDANALMQGFRAYALDDTRPTPELAEILRLRGERKYITSWPALVAGVDIIVTAGEVHLLDRNVIAPAMMIDLFGSYSDRVKRKTKSETSLQEMLRNAHPDIAIEVYVQAIEFDFKNRDGGEFFHGFYEYIEHDIFLESRRAHLLKWLRNYPELPPRTIEAMLDAARADPEIHAGLRSEAARALADEATPSKTKPLWLATAYLLDLTNMRASVKEALAANRANLWAIRDALGYESRVRDTPLHPLSADDLAFLIAEAGAVWPHTDYPEGTSSGNVNPWDATQLILNLITRLSASPLPEHTSALQALLNDTRLLSYANSIRYALSQQETLRREKEYDRPDWPSTLAALANRAPANAADLHALVVEHLRDVAKHIDGDNDNGFEPFWNETRGNMPATPKLEEPCRNALLTRLRPRLVPMGLNVEPEAAMSAKKRVDIAVLGAPLKAIAEVKLAHSPDLWTAIPSQLDHLYTRDPATKGYGTLVVMWFGAKSNKPVTKSPDGWLASTPYELQDALEKTNTSHRLSVVVIDVSASR